MRVGDYSTHMYHRVTDTTVCYPPPCPPPSALAPPADWDSREFVGGETLILQPQVLNYWRSYDPSKVGQALPPAPLSPLHFLPPYFARNALPLLSTSSRDTLRGPKVATARAWQ